MLYPKEFKLIDNKFLLIRWKDNSEQKIKLANLRYNCPCAFCETDRLNKGSTYIPIYSNEQITIVDIKLIGNFAINIIWKDGHNTGIYDFEYLKKILD